MISLNNNMATAMWHVLPFPGFTKMSPWCAVKQSDPDESG